MIRFSRLFSLFFCCAQMLAGSLRADGLPPGEPIDAPTPASVRNQQVTDEARRLLKARDTAGLEALAARLRNSRERLDNGTWLLGVFYYIATRLPQGEADAARAMEFYESWASGHPDSITAQVCFANAMTSYAWRARGGGWASTVTEQGNRLFEERLDKAWQVLDRADKIREKCPGWFAAAQSVALGQGWPREKYLAALERAIAREPGYGTYYTHACHWMLPRWYGNVGDFEKWIAMQADRYPNETRDRQYANFVWLADRMPVRGEIRFAIGRLDWARTKKGFEQWLRVEPDNLMVRFEYTRLALIAGDRSTARQQFERTGGKYHPNLWTDSSEFERARQFAFAGGADPNIGMLKPESSRKLEPETIARVNAAMRIFSGILGGLLAGVCLLILAVQRRRVAAGVVALLFCIPLAAAFGTVAALLPAALLFVYLRRKCAVYPPEIDPPRGRTVLLWLIGLSVLYIGIQCVAGVFACLPLIVEHGSSAPAEMTRLMMSDGSVFRIALNSAWICFLVLAAICGPQSDVSWRNRLGLNQCPMPVAVGWSALAFLLAAGINQVLTWMIDGRSASALKLMALGLQSPAAFYVAIVITAPLFEELLFRGYAYSGLIRRIPFWATAVTTSLLFALCHIQYGPMGLISVFALGMVLSGLRRVTGSVYPCIAVHMAHNLASCLAIQFLTGHT